MPAIEFASDLLTYMNLTARYGREHDICDQCSALMIAAKRWPPIFERGKGS
jgi:hypothetical protein